MELTVRVRDEHFLNLAHLHGAPPYLVLRRLSTIEEPHLAIQAQCER